MGQNTKLTKNNIIYSMLFAGGIGIAGVSYFYPQTPLNYRHFSNFDSTQLTQTTLMNRDLREVGVRVFPSGEFSITYIPPIHRDNVYIYDSQNESICKASLLDNYPLKEFIDNWDDNVNLIDCLPLNDSREDTKVKRAIERISHNLKEIINAQF
ncbi:MAG: hypothetical protein LAT82_05395 [Nanoarchaeota archaeon]|nr:hypothetical protein [Nanoarchaeota archaeon]